MPKRPRRPAMAAAISGAASPVQTWSAALMVGLLIWTATCVMVRAADVYVPPQGCTAFATVQMRGCVVANNYTCAQDAAGDQWEIMFDDSGPFYQSRIDAEAQWIESYSLPSGDVDRLEPGAPDPASFTELLANNLDTYEFSMLGDAGQLAHYKGYDRLSGGRVVIDGVPLERTEFDITATDAQGKVVWRRMGRELVHRDWRLFFPDVEKFDNGSETLTVVGTPVEFDFPGDPDFLTTQPKFDCEALMAKAPGKQTPKEPSDDNL